MERPTYIVRQPPTCPAFTPSGSTEQPFFVVDPPSTSQDYPPSCLPDSDSTSSLRKLSLSFEQPSCSGVRYKPPRLSTSLDITTISLSRRSSSPTSTDGRASPISITLDETKITAPLIENLKSSDVWWSRWFQLSCVAVGDRVLNTESIITFCTKIVMTGCCWC